MEAQQVGITEMDVQAKQLLGIRPLDVVPPLLQRMGQLQAVQAHYWPALDVLARLEELDSLRADSPETSMVESDVPQTVVRGPRETRR